MAKKKYRLAKKSAVNSGMKSLMRLAGPIAYGYVRETISNKLSETAIVQRLPATEFTDEAVMLGANFLLKKVGLNKNPLGRSFLNAQEKIELARIGQTIKDITGNGTPTAISGQTQPQTAILF